MRTSLFVTAVIAVAFASACSRSEAPGSGSPGPSVSTAKPPFGFLSAPVENQAVAPGTFVSGWALDESGIAEVSVTFDDGQKPFVKTGVDFPGVRAQYPNYPDTEKAGYIFSIPKMSPGPHTLTVHVKARNGGTTEIQRHFQVS